MSLKKKILTLTVISTLILSVGCSQKKASEDKKDSTKASAITIVAGSDLTNPNPLFANDRLSMTVMNSLYSPLYVVEETGEKTFYLADSVDVSDDFLTYKVKLKDNLKWHDGKPLTADDVVFTVNTILDKNQNCMSREDFIINDNPVEVKKVDDTTVEFKLSSISTPFEYILGDIRPIPKHIYEGEKDLEKSEENRNPIGSGAYKFKEHKSGELITLEKFDDFYGEKANLDTVNYRVIADANSANTALQNGEVNVKYVSADDVENVKSKDNVNIITFDEGMVDNIIFLQQHNKDLAKKEVRQALAYAINKEEIIKASYKSEEYATKADSLFAPNTVGYTGEVEKYEQNKEKAKQLLEKAGVKDLKLKFGYSTHKPSLEATALVVQNNLKDIGVEVELVPLESSAFINKILNPEEYSFDMALNGYVMGTNPASYASLFVEDGSNNFNKYKNEKVEELFNKALSETDEAKRTELYKEAQKLVIDDMACYPIAYSKSIVAIDKAYDGVEDATPAPIFMFRDLHKLKLK